MQICLVTMPMYTFTSSVLRRSLTQPSIPLKPPSPHAPFDPYCSPSPTLILSQSSEPPSPTNMLIRPPPTAYHRADFPMRLLPPSVYRCHPFATSVSSLPSNISSIHHLFRPIAIFSSCPMLITFCSPGTVFRSSSVLAA
jgi:hypothetical protein